jgi:hypothetical protein
MHVISTNLVKFVARKPMMILFLRTERVVALSSDSTTIGLAICMKSDGIQNLVQLP